MMIALRLRAKRDRDLIQAVKGIEHGERSQVIRDALRSYLNTPLQSYYRGVGHKPRA